MECETCIHEDVCGLLDDYIELFDNLPECDDCFSVKLHCEHYLPREKAGILCQRVKSM